MAYYHAFILANQGTHFVYETARPFSYRLGCRILGDNADSDLFCWICYLILNHFIQFLRGQTARYIVIRSSISHNGTCRGIRHTGIKPYNRNICCLSIGNCIQGRLCIQSRQADGAWSLVDRII